MSRPWWTSDLHFFHKNIIRFSGRPYQDLEEMNWDLVRRINIRCKEGDNLYILGDLTFGRTRETCELLKFIKPHLHWVLGNHDPKVPNETFQKHFASISTYKEIKHNRKKIVMSHYPMESWHRMHGGSWMLHGHCHGTLARAMPNRVDVGVDAGWDWAPVSFEELAAHPNMNMKFEAVDHHEEGNP